VAHRITLSILPYETCRALKDTGFPQPHIRDVGTARYIPDPAKPNSIRIFSPRMEELVAWLNECSTKERGRSGTFHIEHTLTACIATHSLFPAERGYGPGPLEATALLAIAVGRSIQPTPRGRGKVVSLPVRQ